MKLFKFKRFQNQLIFGIVAILTCFSILVAAVQFPAINNSLWKQKKKQVRNLVKSKISILEYYQGLAKQGKISTSEAKRKAKEAVEKARYGEQNRGYFWINDKYPRMVMHPYKPRLNGQDLSGVQDKQGMHLFNRMVKVVKDQGSGFVNYYWQYYDNENRVEPKISYVQEFKPWGWILGTGVYVNEVQDTVISQLLKSLWVGLVFVALLIVAGYFIAKRVSRPIVRMQEKISNIAEGFLDDQELGIDRKDEIGQLAKSMNKMMGNLRQMIKEQSDGIETLASSSSELTSIAEQMNTSSENTVSKANTVASSAEEMSTNLSSVASSMEQTSTNVNTIVSSSEEMSTTIDDISKQAEQAREITTNAVNQADSASKRVNELGDAAQSIGKVTETITAISSQTNLLALNATIEAARAGEAGKGFAVVANEIKELAQQTADATGDISKKIEDIQNTTDTSVGEIKEIIKVINQLEEFVSSIASSMEQQVSTTKEIASNISQVSQGVQEVNENVNQSSQASAQVSKDIAEVNKAANEISNSSAQVQSSAQVLSQVAEKLREMAGKFKA